jgi:DNA-binding beta-propeller fold protein YncE
MSIARLMQMAAAGAAGAGPAPSGWTDPDGTKMYNVGFSNDNVNEYDLSTAWDVSTASYSSVSFSVAVQETSPRGIFFKPEGDKMYIIGTVGDDVNEYALSIAWDVSTASFVQNFSVSSQEANPVGIFFSPDGTKMYVCGQTGVDVNEYDLSTAWDVSSASFVQNFSVATEEASPSGVFFNPDGTKMYVIGYASDNVVEYALSTAWDVSTASYSSVSFSVASQETAPRGFFFKSDGSKMYVVGSTNDTIYQYSTA